MIYNRMEIKRNKRQKEFRKVLNEISDAEALLRNHMKGVLKTFPNAKIVEVSSDISFKVGGHSKVSMRIGPSSIDLPLGEKND